MQKFQKIVISGTARERGRAYGEQLRAEIAQTIDYYAGVFNLSENRILEQAEYFLKVITDFNTDYAIEIEGIAEGAVQDPLWITALNARTEILGLNKPVQLNECTAMCFLHNPVLGQTWDWGKPLENLCVIVQLLRPDGHSIQMLTEPGIIGKIGMNNAGVGVCLNILTLGYPLTGVPIHIILRAILDCKSTEQAGAIIDSAPYGKSSNVIVADKTGNCFVREFAGKETYLVEAFDGNYIHTNHYLGKPINGIDDPLFASSHARLNTVCKRTAAISQSVESMKDILSDRSHKTFPVYRPYMPDPILGEVGTVATIIMNLEDLNLHIRKGSKSRAIFNEYRL